MEMSFTSLFILVYSRAVCRSFHLELCAYQTVLVSKLKSGADSFNSSKARVMCKCLGSTMRCWDCTKVFGMPPDCAHAETKTCCRPQASSRCLFPSLYQSHTYLSACLCQDKFVSLRAGRYAEQYVCL